MHDDAKAHTPIPHAESQQRPAKLVRSDEGKTQGADRIALRFTLRRVRRLDPCAKYGSCKALIDGLRYAGILHDDTEDDITLEVDQVRVKHYAEEKTEIEITHP